MEDIKKKRKLKKIDSNSPTWEKLANQLARSYVQISICRDCGYPVISGYQCTFCSSTNP